MMESRSAGGALNPDRITTRLQLMTALAAVKGDCSYRRLLAASELLITKEAARRAGAEVGRGWRFERLAKGSVSDWMSGRGLPTPNKLITFLHVCGIAPEDWRSWIDAVGRVRQDSRGRAIVDHDPLLLGVHPAIHTASDGPDHGAHVSLLTPYVVRDHDHEVRQRLYDGHGHQLVVLVGGSSVGKTRACVEAVRDILPGWPVVHPATAEELLTLLEGGIAPGTVLWLNETQRYLQPRHGRDVANALRRVLSSPARTVADRVVILGSMWLDPYWHTLTRQPQRGEPDPHAEVRELLTQPGVRISVPDDFSTLTSNQRAELSGFAAQDLRLATAVAAGGERLRITQTLAGGPLLLRRYADLAGTPAYAVLTAAMDARRIGCESPLPAALLEHAAPGYLTPEQRAAGAETGWFTVALKAAAQRIHGVHALTPIRTDETIDEADSYILHEFLAQHALTHRGREPIPTRLWEAATGYVAELDDLRRISDHAYLRRLPDYAIPIYRILADAGNRHGMSQLAELLARQGDAAAVTELRIRADAGGQAAAAQLGGLLSRQGHPADAVHVWDQAFGDDSPTTRRLAELLTEQGDVDRAVSVWQSSDAVWRYRDRQFEEFDDSPEDWAWIEQEQLVALLAGRGDAAAIAELRAMADAGYGAAVQLLARQGEVGGD